MVDHRRQYTKATMNLPIVTRSARSILFVRAHFDYAFRMLSSIPKLEPKGSVGHWVPCLKYLMGIQRVLKEGKILKALIRVPRP